MILDTHEAVEKMVEAGASKKMAEAIVKTLNSSSDNLSTKQDIREVRSEIKEVRSEIAQIKTELKSDIKVLEVALKTELNWVKAALFGIIGLLVKLTFFS